MEESGTRLLALLNKLLDLSKLEAGSPSAEFAIHDLATPARSAFSEMEGLARDMAVHVALRIGCADTWLVCDALQIVQLLRNLLGNALKFTPTGRAVYISVDRVDPLPGSAGEALRLTVSDEGVGIPEAEIEAVFDRFVQSTRTKSGAGGTGLGLAICRQIVIHHGGPIQARGNAAGGSDFLVVLPRGRPGAVNPGGEEGS